MIKKIAAIFFVLLANLVLVLLMSGCRTCTTFEKGDMKMTRTAPMFSQVEIKDVVFYGDDGKPLAAMKGYHNDGSAAAIKELGNTLKAAGQALEAAAVKTIE